VLQRPLVGAVAKKWLCPFIISGSSTMPVGTPCSFRFLGMRFSMHICRLNSDIGISTSRPKYAPLFIRSLL
jgi:hypothetical protein